MERTRFVFSGSGGQGVITAAIMLAEAAVMYENLVAVQSQSYGPEARGGSTKSDVIISDSDIYFPKVNHPNILICLTQEAYNKFYTVVRPGGFIIVDNKLVKTYKKVDARQKELPLYQSVIDKIGNPLALNMCTLGAVIGLTKIIKLDSAIKVINARIPKNYVDMNIKAVNLGYELAE
ncbi:MAG: 2-oxoacid:acceptor oxidoreductase family protein [Desulfobacterales bacterium]|nr:2-oxoacid:acceptor oxidoreductase family protein [Desulfobacterales bacterium]